MKLLHLADLHIGRSLGYFDLLEDQKYIFQQILDIVHEQQVAAVLLAGDIYDRPIPSEGAVRLFDWFLSELAASGTKVFIISGNHDSDERLSFASSLLSHQGVYIAAKYQGELFQHCLEEEGLRVHFYLLPFVKASQVRHFFPEEKLESYDAAVKAVLAHGNVARSTMPVTGKDRLSSDEIPAKGPHGPGTSAGQGLSLDDAVENKAAEAEECVSCNVLLAHQFVAGRYMQPELSGAESVGVQQVGLVEQIGTDTFDAFDYVALGHIHRPQALERDTLRYAGSPLKYSLTECSDDKSVPLVELTPQGVTVELLPLKPLRELRHITGPLEELLRPENIDRPEDYIYVTLTDEEPRDNAMNIIQCHYPRTVKLDYKNSRTQEIAREEVMEAAGARSFQELVGEFYEKVYGQAISQEEMDIMQELGEKAGAVDEAR